MEKQDMEQLDRTARNLKENGAVRNLLQAKETKRMVELLGNREEVHGAAKAAAKGDPSQLMKMMQQLMNDPEGAKLMELITKQVRDAGL